MSRVEHCLSSSRLDKNWFGLEIGSSLTQTLFSARVWIVQSSLAVWFDSLGSVRFQLKTDQLEINESIGESNLEPSSTNQIQVQRWIKFNSFGFWTKFKFNRWIKFNSFILESSSTNQSVNRVSNFVRVDSIHCHP
jgi:hypothetical protein